jgi:hypothetical protein
VECLPQGTLTQVELELALPKSMPPKEGANVPLTKQMAQREGYGVTKWTRLLSTRGISGPELGFRNTMETQTDLAFRLCDLGQITPTL